MSYDPEDPDFGTAWVRTYDDGWDVSLKVNENKVAWVTSAPSLVEALRMLADKLEAVPAAEIDFFITGPVRPAPTQEDHCG